MRLFALLGALVILIAIPAFTWGLVVTPCDPTRSVLAITALVNNSVRAKFTLPSSPTQRPLIEVGPDDTVSVIAELGVWPQGCRDTFAFDWETVFVRCDPQSFRSQTEAPTRARLEVTFGPGCVNTQSEDYIVVVARDMAGQAVQTAIIRLKGT